jgi:ATP-dependent DNA ligase
MPAKPPRFIRPQLTLLAESPPAGDAWAHELKFDGYRLHARIADKQAKLLTRTGLDWTAKYETVAAALAKLATRSAYVDGELCAIRLDGTTSFSDLQAATDHKDSTRLIYFAFDLLFIDGANLTTLALVERKARLKALLRAGT